MKKMFKEEITKIAKKAVVKTATYYANVTCPFITYQPRISNEVKKLRKF